MSSLGVIIEYEINLEQRKLIENLRVRSDLGGNLRRQGYLVVRMSQKNFEHIWLLIISQTFFGNPNNINMRLVRKDKGGILCSKIISAFFCPVLVGDMQKSNVQI